MYQKVVQKKSCYKLTKLLKVTICAFLDDKTWVFSINSKFEIYEGDDLLRDNKTT